MEHPQITVRTERGIELTPKQVEIQEDAEGAFAITITMDDSDLSGERTAGT
jgi:hypothetical protein